MEMLALDKWTDSEQPEIVGALTTGNIWQFGILHRHQKYVEENITVYRVTEELETVLRILLAAILA